MSEPAFHYPPIAVSIGMSGPRVSPFRTPRIATPVALASLRHFPSHHHVSTCLQRTARLYVAARPKLYLCPPLPPSPSVSADCLECGRIALSASLFVPGTTVCFLSVPDFCTGLFVLSYTPSVPPVRSIITAVSTTLLVFAVGCVSTAVCSLSTGLLVLVRCVSTGLTLPHSVPKHRVARTEAGRCRSALCYVSTDMA
eukprot:622347-Rhodomonas_salina.11